AGGAAAGRGLGCTQGLCRVLPAGARASAAGHGDGLGRDGGAGSHRRAVHRAGGCAQGLGVAAFRSADAAGFQRPAAVPQLVRGTSPGQAPDPGGRGLPCLPARGAGAHQATGNALRYGSVPRHPQPCFNKGRLPAPLGPATIHTGNTIMALVLILAALIVFIVLVTTKLKLHPFLALLSAALLAGLAYQLPLLEI